MSSPAVGAPSLSNALWNWITRSELMGANIWLSYLNKTLRHKYNHEMIIHKDISYSKEASASVQESVHIYWQYCSGKKAAYFLHLNLTSIWKQYGWCCRHHIIFYDLREFLKWCVLTLGHRCPLRSLCVHVWGLVFSAWWFGTLLHRSLKTNITIASPVDLAVCIVFCIHVVLHKHALLAAFVSLTRW